MQKNDIAVEKHIIDYYEKKLMEYRISSSEKWAIYGSGNGAEVIFEILRRWNLQDILVAIVDNADVVAKGRTFHGFSVRGFEEVYNHVDGIIIGALVYHEAVYERVLNELRSLHNDSVKVVNLFGHCNTEDDVKEYVSYIENLYSFKNKDLFKEFDDKGFKLEPQDTKVIAWYLPQFHRIDTNDHYYGRGFTEWTNTTKAIPMFTGHYQPHIPYDVGYYDLNNPEVFERQIYLAKSYGIYGFSFYYYWFSGKRIMEKPLNYFLAHPELKMNFCITWANENWSALWDGGNNDLIFEQNLKPDDDIKFIQDAYPYMSDPRYISVKGKKLLIIYRATIWEKDRVKELISNFRAEARRLGLGELYIMLCNTREFDEEVAEWGADGLVEFPPNGVKKYSSDVIVEGYLNPNFIGYIKDTKNFFAQKKYLCKHNSKEFYRGAIPSWDNTARKAYNGATIYKGLTPQTFELWLTDIIKESHEIHSVDNDFVFVNAWNEWAEGAHLEPDMMYGYANLDAVRNALEKNRK